MYISSNTNLVFLGLLGTSKTWNSHEGDEKEALNVQGHSTEKCQWVWQGRCKVSSILTDLIVYIQYVTTKSLKLSSKWVVAELSCSIYEGDMKNNVWLSKLNRRKKNSSWKCWKRSCYRNKCLKPVKFNGIEKFFFPNIKKW